MTTDEALEWAELEATYPSRDDIPNEVMAVLAGEVRRLRDSNQALIINCDRIETESAQWQSRALAAEEMLALDTDVSPVTPETAYIDTGVVTAAASAACAECASLRDQLREASAVCACGHPDSDHEHYGEDGLTHDCEHDCIRVSPAVASVIATLRDQIRLLREAAGEQDVRLSGVESERDHYRNALAKVSAHAPDGTISCGQCGANLGSDGMVEALTDTMQQLVAVEAERDALTEQLESARQTYHAMLDELNAKRKALREWQMGVGDTETETQLVRVTAERDALAKRVAELTAQRDTAYGYGQDGGEPPWMK